MEVLKFDEGILYFVLHVEARKHCIFNRIQQYVIDSRSVSDLY